MGMKRDKQNMLRFQGLVVCLQKVVCEISKKISTKYGSRNYPLSVLLLQQEKKRLRTKQKYI